MRSILLSQLIALSTLFCTAAGAAEVSFSDLLHQMIELDYLSRMPEPSYDTKQFSSYDRKSTDPTVLTDENWFANLDRGQFLRTEETARGTEYVLMDAEGPGAIVRFWSANPTDAGNILVYLDGAEEPTIDMPLTEMLGGEGDAPFIKPIAGMRARGWNSYLPIPYAEHCKITSTKGDYYYQINYRTYEEGTEVETYTPALAEAHAELIQQVAQALENPYEALKLPQERAGTTQYKVEVQPEQVVSVAKFESPGALYRFTAKVDAQDLRDALRGCLIEIYCDDLPMPVVSAPLGDFFGSAPGLNPYEGLPCGVLEDGTQYSHWVMPYRQRAELRLVNHGKQTVQVSGELVTGAYDWGEDSLYFHAKWRGEKEIATRPRQDWTALNAEGPGRFVGLMMQVTNPTPAWWGEGDEKIYVDNEPFPSHFGTGTEDYFGYAWCSPELFTHPYHNQPRCDGPGNFGYTSVNRFHILDNIPFQEQFRFDLEVWHWEEVDVDQAVVAYWYSAPGAKDAFSRPVPQDLELGEAPEFETFEVEGALEGEEFEVVKSTGGTAQTQQNMTWRWSKGGQLWWVDGAPGDQLVLRFRAPAAGAYQVKGNFTTAPDYGIARISINGEAVGDPIDFYSQAVEAENVKELGVHRLREGFNEMAIEITGANEQAVKRHMVGLDYLLLEPVDYEDTGAL